jgi:hypothetical protein
MINDCTQPYESEWTALKDLVKGYAGVRVDGQTLEWCVNPECVQFGPVAAIFTLRDRSRAVLFQRRTRAAGSFNADPPFAPDTWILEPEITGRSVVWSCRPALNLNRDCSSKQLAEQIIARLAKYHMDYMEACVA